MAHYIIQVIAFQLVFLLIYDTVLKKETFFNWNRGYLMVSAFISVVVHFVKVEKFKEVIPQQFIINLPEVVIGNTIPSEPTNLQLESFVVESKTFWTWETMLYVGMAIATLLLVFKMAKIIYMLSQNPKSKLGNLFIIKLQNSNAAFSFFNYVFLGERLEKNEKEAILKHEFIHVKEKHSLDLLFFEVLRILFWFNPLIYMYQNRIITLHEFIADAKAIENDDKASYYQNLLTQVFETKNISFINPFFKQSLIKKRIVMLSKSKSKQVNLLKYALLIPMVFGMLVYSSCEKQNETKQEDALELSQYNFSMKLGEQNNKMSEENIIIHDKYEYFLKANPEYVSWAIFDKVTKTVSYSVHSINEKFPQGYESSRPIEVGFPENGSTYKMYMLFKRIPKNEESKIGKVEYNNALEVPFAVIDQVPIFPGCEGLSPSEQKACMSKNIQYHVNKNFNTKIAEENNLVGKQRINVIFKIDAEGNIVGVRSRAPHPILEAEAVRVIGTMPKMIPGEHKGRKVTVLYSLPIVFQVAEDKPLPEKE
ncbi:M56 family metallopeptidase [Mariniflexile sp.]|uniref:M56 family metallopeptidase n=1 Tax=Mariniflexile sp. TaxID=1979402 RepID=UPI004047CEEB